MLSKRASPKPSCECVFHCLILDCSIRQLCSSHVRTTFFPPCWHACSRKGPRLNARHALKEQATTIVSTTNSIPLQFRSGGASMHPIQSVTVSCPPLRGIGITQKRAHLFLSPFFFKANEKQNGVRVDIYKQVTSDGVSFFFFFPQVSCFPCGADRPFVFLGYERDDHRYYGR